MPVGWARLCWIGSSICPTEWINDRERCRQAGIPEDRRFATKPQLAQQMWQRALEAGVPATWVTGDSVYGADRRLRLWLEAQPQATCWPYRARSMSGWRDDSGR